MIGLLLALVPLPHLVEEPLDVGGVSLDAEQRGLEPLLPHLSPGTAKAGKKNKNIKLRTSLFSGKINVD